jgi:hypothetical protein
MHSTQQPSPRQHLHLLHNLINHIIDLFENFVIPDFPQNPNGSIPNQPKTLLDIFISSPPTPTPPMDEEIWRNREEVL